MSKLRSGDPIRRIVTGLDDDHHAVAIFDEVTPHVFHRPHGAVSSLLWVTRETPAKLEGRKDDAAGFDSVTPPAGGTVFRIVDFPPTSKEDDGRNLDFQQSLIKDAPPAKGIPPRHPFMHRTRTIDYAIVLQGEIDLLLDDTEIHCQAGDVIVQRATNHAWVNRGTDPCRIAFVLIDSQEP